MVIPNPKLKLMDQVREVLRVKHYAIRTEQAYCDWIRRYVCFHGMGSREELFPGADKVEQFLSDLAVNGWLPNAKGQMLKVKVGWLCFGLQPLAAFMRLGSASTYAIEACVCAIFPARRRTGSAPDTHRIPAVVPLQSLQRYDGVHPVRLGRG